MPNDSIIFTYSTNKMESLFKYKDTLPDSLRANVVYKFKCGGCNATYVGQTGRHLHIRIHEHLGVSSITGNQIKTSSSIYEHIQQTGHWADNTCFSTICHTSIKCDLPILERFYIKNLNQT